MTIKISNQLSREELLSRKSNFVARNVPGNSVNVTKYTKKAWKPKYDTCLYNLNQEKLGSGPASTLVSLSLLLSKILIWSRFWFLTPYWCALLSFDFVISGVVFCSPVFSLKNNRWSLRKLELLKLILTWHFY